MIQFFMIAMFSYSSYAMDMYKEKVQPLFDGRCIACHSCYNAPCQLNLQSYEGFQRGASKEIVYQGTRVDSIEPTRMWVDAFTVKDWRKKKFFSVDEHQFLRIIEEKTEGNLPKVTVGDSNVCAENKEEMNDFLSSYPERAMPYGLPKLDAKDVNTIKEWIGQGMPGPQRLKKKIPAIGLEWETFLNRRDLKHKLLARYLYEHMFLAHITFNESERNFFKLIRTDKPCQARSLEVATRTPIDDPKIKEIYYCFTPLEGSVVAKTHIPLVLDKTKFKRYQEIFFAQKWNVTALPSYERVDSANPFITFKDIPVRARYEFLLEDARYHVNTFIKGPVCNGSAAVNSIQEQFYGGFLHPDADLMVQSAEFEKESRDDLILPGSFGSDVKLMETTSLISELTKKREAYRKLKKEWFQKHRPNGLKIEDLWIGTKRNPIEGMLTIFRHDDNASVFYGYLGDSPKTFFYLDYSLFERLVYNLVVNFDVFGNVGHQSLTRIYMDLIRMEAEENFLLFMPPEIRKPMRDSWYKGALTELKMKYVFPNILNDMPVDITYKDPQKAKIEFLSMVRPNKGQEVRTMVLRQSKGETFANYFPEVTLVLVKGKANRVVSIIRNREHANISWILGEDYRLAPEEDSLLFLNGVAGNYPELFLLVPENKYDSFVESVGRLKTQESFQELIKKYEVKRTERSFWSTYDDFNHLFQGVDFLESGYLDLTRYSL